jgi:transposase-like protein
MPEQRTNGPARDPAKERFWRRIMTRWQRSRQAICDFCSAEGLSQASFYAWRRELRRRDDQGSSGRSATTTRPSRRPTAKIGPSFVSLQVAATPTSASLDAAPYLELVLPRGIILRIPSGCDRVTLAMVLALLEQRPC